MLKQIILSGTLVISGAINISYALATEKLARPAERIEPAQNDTLERSGISTGLINRPPSDVASRDARRPSQALMKEIVDWLSSHFDLPAIHEYPRIEFASAAHLTMIRQKEISPWNPRKNGIEEPVVAVAQSHDIVALYEGSVKTIFLVDDWAGATPADISVLVHEMVHHLQNVGRLVYECSPAREKLAYQAQDLWLKRFGQDLESTFGVDKLTILVRSACSL